MSHTKLKPDSISALASSTVFFGYPDYRKLIEAFFSEVFLSQDTIDNLFIELKDWRRRPNVLETISMPPKLCHPINLGEVRTHK